MAFRVLFGLAPLWVLAREVLFLLSRVSAPRVWGFPVVSLMFSFRAPLLSFLPLGASCDVGVLCVPSASLLSGAFGGFVCLLSAVLFLSYIPVFRLSRSSCLCLSLFSFSFLCCLVYLFGSFFLFCALASGPPGVSPVTASSSVGRPASLSSAVAAASSPSFGFSPLANVLWGCSPLGVVSLGSGSAGASRHLVLLPV